MKIKAIGNIITVVTGIPFNLLCEVGPITIEENGKQLYKAEVSATASMTEYGVTCNFADADGNACMNFSANCFDAAENATDFAAAKQDAIIALDTYEQVIADRLNAKADQLNSIIEGIEVQ